MPHLSSTFSATVRISFLSILIGSFAYAFILQGPFQLNIPSQPNLSMPRQPYYPVGAVNYIEKHHLTGKLLTSFNWGEFLLWTLYPQCLVAIDGRYETVYPEKIVKEYFDFYYGRSNWRQFLEDYPPDMILLPKSLKIYNLLRKDPGWRLSYEDPGCVLLLLIK